jgi:hypothetical protein
MGLFMRPPRAGRSPDRCEHAGRAVFAVSASAGQVDRPNIRGKAEADAALDELRTAIKGRHPRWPRRAACAAGRPAAFPRARRPVQERHVTGNHFTLARAIDYRLKPLLEHFGDRPIAEIRTADVQDFIADLSEAAHRARPKRNATPGERLNRSLDRVAPTHAELGGRPRVPRSHAVPARNGTLIRKLREDNRRHRRVTEDEARLLQVSQPLLRS